MSKKGLGNKERERRFSKLWGQIQGFDDTDKKLLLCSIWGQLQGLCYCSETLTADRIYSVFAEIVRRKVRFDEEWKKEGAR